MQKRHLGKSGLKVSALSYGAMTFGGEGMFGFMGKTQEEEAERLCGICFDAGITSFDTADAYSNGRSEEILGYALRNKRHDVEILTKCWGPMGPGPNDMGSSRKHVVEACEASLKRLKTDYIDLYQIHAPDSFTPLEETLRALDDLVSAGKVRYIGCSNYASWQLMKALAISDSHGWERYVSHQIYYSIAGRDAETDLLPLGVDQGVGTIVWGPLAFGVLTGKFRRGKPDPEGARGTLAGVPGGIDRERLDTITDALAEVAEGRNATMAQVAMNYLLRKPAISTVLFGARDEKQLRDNVAAASWTMSDEELALLDKASDRSLPYPHWAHRHVFAARNPV
ncbi:MAG TPA: aldo/keto reductase [Alphaproteobacteria bacterium]|jgi:aryl-alcohol dehydrogenase-like predicted oxidoreductase|nr:aldo/keto reductase [Alphaproteobacteria bacterium]